MEIVLARIDDRMIHGQVMTAWARVLGKVDAIVICDDETAGDTFLQTVLRQLAPPKIRVEVYTLAESVEYLTSNADEPLQVLVLTRTPDAMLGLIDAGIELPKVNIGGMGIGPGRSTLHRNVAVSDDELATLREIQSRGLTVELQMVPNDKAIDLSKLGGGR